MEAFPACREMLEAYHEPVAWKEFLDRIAETVGTPGSGMLLAVDGETPAGEVVEARKTDDVVEIRRLIVDRGRRGQCIGLRLITKCPERIHADGDREAHPVTKIFLEGALRLCDRLGFETVPIPDTTPETFGLLPVAMRLPLQSAAAMSAITPPR